MLWRLSPLCKVKASTKGFTNASIKNSNVSAALLSGRRCFLCSPCYLRSITTSASLRRLVQPVDDPKTQDGPVDYGPVIPRHPLKDYKLPIQEDFEPPIQEDTELLIQREFWYTRCEDLLNSDHKASGEEVSVTGMIKSIRKQKHSAFVHLTDGSCFQPIQVVLDRRLAVAWVSPTI
jgi:hypothetical protein